MFFQSSKIRKATTDLPDGKHMSGCPDGPTHTCTRHRQEASGKTPLPCLHVWGELTGSEEGEGGLQPEVRPASTHPPRLDPLPDPHPGPAAALLPGTARLQRPANAQGGFSVCAVDLGLVRQQKAA